MQAQETSGRFDYKGDIFLQGFVLNRDLPLKRPEELARKNSETGKSLDFPYASQCPLPDWVEDKYRDGSEAKSRCKEQDDYFRMRLRADFSVRPSEYTGILYSIEVGYFTFGRESGLSGPDTGGKGGGRTNIESQKLIFEIHDKSKASFFRAGVFPYSTPQGLVTASSGAGFHGNHDIPLINSSFEAVYIRMEDTSMKDGDSNGFSDETFQNVHTGILKWKFAPAGFVRSELYSMTRIDNDPETLYKGQRETSQMHWNGLFVTFRKGPFSLLLHGVSNQGHFHRKETFAHMNPLFKEIYIRKLKEIGFEFVPEAIPVDQKNLYSLLKGEGIENPAYSVLKEGWSRELPARRHPVSANAGIWEMQYQAADNIQFALMQAGGTGRLGNNSDGSSSDYRRDQFRTANSSFQVSDISVDASGGYSIFQGGSLTGIQIQGGSVRYRIFDSLQGKISYFTIKSNHAPTTLWNAYHTKYPFYVKWILDDKNYIRIEPDFNVKFTSHPGIRKDERYIGQEVNLQMEWRLLAGMKLEARAAWFEAGDGYRAWKDVEYGKDITEVSFSLSQLF